MEKYIITSKLAIIISLLTIIHHEHILALPWGIFVILVYISLNLTTYIFMEKTKKRISLLLSLILIGAAYFQLNPLFILLLPLNVYELFSDWHQKRWFLFILTLFPMILIKEQVFILYGLVMVFSWLIYSLATSFTNRVTLLEKENDDMRHAIARLSKTIHENQEYIKQSEYTFKLEERNQISQKIHDQIGHSMTGALIQMEAAKRLIERDRIKATELLQNAINISSEGIENIRITLKNNKPRTEQMGIQRMKLFIDEFMLKHKMKIMFLYKGNLDMITPIQWKIMYENVSESLTNTMKYAEATNISIEIQVLNKFVKVVVKDNGKGAMKWQKGLGIIGMEERTAGLNGKIIVDGSNGFSVTTLLPLD